MTEESHQYDQCHFCDAPATSRCRRCHKLYCDAHGANFCDECLDPASAVPSPVVFRGSLVALAVGTLVAVWLLVSPPQLEGRSNPEISAAPTETPQAETTPASPTPAGTPQPTATEAPTSTPEPQVYVVESGDTLSEIAKEFGVTVEAIMEYNGLSSTAIARGQELLIPPQ